MRHRFGYPKIVSSDTPFVNAQAYALTGLEMNLYIEKILNQPYNLLMLGWGCRNALGKLLPNTGQRTISRILTVEQGFLSTVVCLKGAEQCECSRRVL
jgi:hypothetical protein